MIKKDYQITVRDYDIVERTGRISHLKSKYNILPTFIFRRKIAKELLKIVKELNRRDAEEDERTKALWETNSLTVINKLRAVYFGLLSSTIRIRYTSIANLFNYDKKRVRIKNKNNFSYFADKAKELTGIEIKTNADIEKFRRKLEFKMDKYYENFITKQRKYDNDSREYLMGFVITVFSFLKIPLNPEITVYEFIEAKKNLEKESSKYKHDGRGNANI